MSLWFVTPAWQRYALSAVCFDQRRHVIDVLVSQGVEAHCVVIADDENLDLARERGFDTVEQDNEFLGRKFNDGMEYAGKHGAEFVVPIGSDSWIDPAYFFPFPLDSVTRTSANYCAVTANRMAILSVGGKGAGPYMFHRSLLEPRGFRPADDQRKNGIDGSTVRGINAPINWRQRSVHPYQYVGFRGAPTITPYQILVKAWGVEERTDPWPVLAKHYSADLIERARLALS